MLLRNTPIFNSHKVYIIMCSIAGIGASLSEFSLAYALKGIISGSSKEISLIIIPIFLFLYVFEFLSRSLPEFYRIKFVNLAIFTTTRAFLNNKLDNIEEFQKLTTSIKHAGKYISKKCNLIISFSTALIYISIILFKFGWFTLLAFIPLLLIALLLLRRNKISLSNSSQITTEANQLRRQLSKNAFILRVNQSIKQCLIYYEKLQLKVTKDEEKIHLAKYQTNLLTDMLGGVTIVLSFYIGIKYFNFDSKDGLIYFYAFIRLSQKAGNINRHLVYYKEYQKTHNHLINKIVTNYPLEEGEIKFEKINDLKVRNLIFGYTHSLLKPIDLHLKKGQFILIKGKSGLGKSTLLKTIAGSLPLISGEILINDKMLSNSNLDLCFYTSKHVLFNANLNNNLTLFESNYTTEELMSALTKAQCDFLGKNNLYTILSGEDPIFSSGQLQRINLARVFVKPNSLIILDEAFSNLDQHTESKILNEILKLKENRIIIMATHKVIYDELADQIINLEAYCDE